MVDARTFRHRYLILGAALTPLALVAGAASAGGGHGSYVAARTVLPFACLVIGDYGGAALVTGAVAVLQWPLYGWILDRTGQKIWAGFGIAAAHLSLCTWLFERGMK